MIFKKVFGKKPDHSDYGKLISGMIFLRKKHKNILVPKNLKNSIQWSLEFFWVPLILPVIYFFK